MIKGIARVQISNEDWKTQLAKGYSNIPKGETVDVEEKLVSNLYGIWCVVHYKGNRYYTVRSNIMCAE